MTRALMKVSGVENVVVDLRERLATISHGGADLEAMKVAVDDAGYEVVGVA